MNPKDFTIYPSFALNYNFTGFLILNVFDLDSRERERVVGFCFSGGYLRLCLVGNFFKARLETVQGFV